MKYQTDNEAIDHLKRNGYRVKESGSTIFVTNQPGLKLLGACDYLRKNRRVIIEQKQQKKGR